MKILITNDDGIEAKGLRLLAEWAKKLGEVTVIAPKVEQSAKSHAIAIAKKMEIKRVPFIDGVCAYSVDSTPADCVRFGVMGLGVKYDLILSGINYGLNVGADIVYSGTIAATFESARLGIPSLALSCLPKDQENTVNYLDEVYAYVVNKKLLDENPIYNINVPHEPKGIRITQQGSPYFADRFIKMERDIYLQDGEPVPDEYPDDATRDTVAIALGYISVTPLNASRTNMQVFEKLKNM